MDRTNVEGDDRCLAAGGLYIDDVTVSPPSPLPQFTLEHFLTYCLSTARNRSVHKYTARAPKRFDEDQAGVLVVIPLSSTHRYTERGRDVGTCSRGTAVETFVPMLRSTSIHGRSNAMKGLRPSWHASDRTAHVYTQIHRDRARRR